jgi:hypothetical protein
MSEEITASFKPDVAAYEQAYQWTCPKLGVRKMVLIFVILGSAAWLCFSISEGDISVGGLGPPSLLVGFAGRVLVRIRNSKSDFLDRVKQMPGLSEQTQMTFKQDGFDSQIGESRGFVSWTHVYSTAATPDGVLIYAQKDVFDWLPKTAFNSEADYNRFLDLLAAKTKHSKLG